MKFKLLSYVTFSLLLSSAPVLLSAKPIESPVLSMIDGSLINGFAFGEISQFRRDVVSMLHGKLQADKSRVGAYTYQDQRMCIAQLARLEHKSGSDQALQELFEQMMADFKLVASPFRARVNNAKEFVQQLIVQSCKDRQRPESLLITWSQTPAKDEETVFYGNVTSIHSFATMLRDLIDFLGDLMESCPAAKQQYAAIRKQIIAQNKQ